MNLLYKAALLADARRPESDRYRLSVIDAALMFRTDIATIHEWARTGRLTSIHDAMGQQRFNEAEIRAVMLADYHA